jgi:hypothetical protein
MKKDGGDFLPAMPLHRHNNPIERCQGAEILHLMHFSTPSSEVAHLFTVFCFKSASNKVK